MKFILCLYDKCQVELKPATMPTTQMILVLLVEVQLHYDLLMGLKDDFRFNLLDIYNRAENYKRFFVNTGTFRRPKLIISNLFN